MIVFELSRERRARIWFCNPEEHVVQPSSTRTLSIKPNVHVKDYRSVVVVEMLAHAGGRIEYALLGATAVESGSTRDEDVILDVSVTASAGPIFANSLAGKLDTVRWGLPSEYADAVVVGARDAMLAEGAPDVSRVRFEWAAHGYVGSSSVRFGRLARLVMRLLVAPKETDLRALVDAE